MNHVVLNILRDTVTVTLFGLFIALLASTWSSKRRAEFAEAANLVFDEGDRPRAEAADAQEAHR